MTKHISHTIQASLEVKGLSEEEAASFLVMSEFLSSFKDDLRQAASAQGIQIEDDAISIASRSAYATAKEKGIPSEATRKEAARLYVEKLRSFCL